MNPRLRAGLQILLLLAVLVTLFVLFPAALRFIEMAARSLRYFWWLILLFALVFWLLWGLGRKPRR